MNCTIREARFPGLILFVIALGLASAARADTITTIDFQNVPVLGPGPQLYTQAGPAQTIAIPDVASISGGVVLGVGSSFTGVPGVTSSNVFATASGNIVGPNGFGLGDMITIDVAGDMVASEAVVPVINGIQTAQSYAVTAFAGTDQVSQQVLSNVPSFTSATADLTGDGITSITIAPLNTASWDFATATMTLSEALKPNGSIQPPHIVQDTPEPASATLALGALAITGLLIRFRRPGV